MPDQSKVPNPAKPLPPELLTGRPSEAEKVEWLRKFSEFDGREWTLIEYRGAYKKASVPQTTANGVWSSGAAAPRPRSGMAVGRLCI